MADERYDAIVIGTSQGVCANTGCTPTKTMVAGARLAHQARPARSTAYAWVRYRSTDDCRILHADLIRGEKAKLPMSAVIRAIETAETRGFMTAMADAISSGIAAARRAGDSPSPSASATTRIRVVQAAGLGR